MSDQHEALNAQIRYIGEANARMVEVKSRVRAAKHFLRRRDHEHAKDELLHVINEARKLRLHLEAWDAYVAQPTRPPTKEKK